MTTSDERLKEVGRQLADILWNDIFSTSGDDDPAQERLARIESYLEREFPRLIERAARELTGVPLEKWPVKKQEELLARLPEIMDGALKPVVDECRRRLEERKANFFRAYGLSQKISDTPARH
jgi:hypothetical protein